MGLFNRFGKKSTKDEATGNATSDPSAPATEATGQQPDNAEAQSASGFMGRLRQGLRRTSQLLNTDIRDIFKQEGRLVDDAVLDQLYAVLVQTDMGAGPAGEIRDQIRTEFRGRVASMEAIHDRVKTQLLLLMSQDEVPLNVSVGGPTVIVVVGVNGSGKTTSIAKLTHHLIAQGKRVVLGAGDTFRAAAVQQLTVWAERLGAQIVTGETGADPASVAHRAIAKTIEDGADVCIIDTAGRLQTQSHLMDQLGKVRRVIEKQVESAPHEVLLVLDATAGQNGISQAKGFSEAVQCTGIILSKLDGTAKGGVIVPIRQQFDIPVKFIGLGETQHDLVAFDPEQFVAALFA